MRGASAYLLALAPRVAVSVGARTVHARPLSAECVRRASVELVSRDIAVQKNALTTVLQAAFPRTERRWFRRTPNHVRAILAMEPALINGILQTLFAVPSFKKDDTNDDIVERIIASHRLPVYGPPASDRQLSKEAVIHCTQIAYGADWYFNPQRWPTSDGYVPWGVCVIAYEALDTWGAQSTLRMTQAHVLAHGGKEVRPLHTQITNAAFPVEH